MGDVASELIDELLNRVQNNTDVAGKVIFLLLTGACDGNLDGVELAVRQRIQHLNGLPRDAVGLDSNSVPLAVGDKVFFNNGCSPKYLRGTGGEVVGKYGKKVRVLVADDPKAERFRAKSVLVVPDIITKV